MADESEVNITWKAVIVIIFIGAILTTGLLTKLYVEKQTQEEVVQSFNVAFNVCVQRCGILQPAFININGANADCVCLQVADNGNPTQDNIPLENN